MRKLWNLFLIWMIAVSLTPRLHGNPQLPDDDYLLRKKKHAARASTLALNPGWTFLQDVWWNCSTGTNSCETPAQSSSTSNMMLNTTTGSVWAVASFSDGTNNLTISSVSGGSAAWTHCGSCHSYNSSGDNVDGYYATGGSAGTNQITVTLSGNPSSYWYIEFAELLPPSGYTGSLDTSGSVVNTSCTTCTGVGLTLAATDAVIEFQDYANGMTKWNAWSSPFTTDYTSNGLYLNASSGSLSAPTTLQSSSGYDGFVAMAFKSTAGNFTTPAAVFALKNYTASNYTVSGGGATLTCNDTCSITIPSTSAGDLLYAVYDTFIASQSSYPPVLSSVSGGGTWTVPSGSSTCATQVHNGESAGGSFSLGCAYNLSVSGSTTSVTFTFPSEATSFQCAIFEVSRTSGSFSLYAQNSTAYSSSANTFNGQALTLGSGPYVVFQGTAMVGGIAGLTLYAQPYLPDLGPQFSGVPGQVGTYWLGGDDILLNTKNGTAPVWAYPAGGLSPQGNPAVNAVAFD